MNLDSFLTDALAAVLVGMTVYGGILALPPKPHKERSINHVWVFISLGIVALILSVWQNHQNGKEKNDLNRQITALSNHVASISSATASTSQGLANQSSRAQTESKHRQEIRTKLGKFVSEGTQIRNQSEADSISKPFLSRWHGWESRVAEYLEINVGSDYAARFRAASIPGVIPFQNISSEVGELENILKDFRD